MTERTAHLIRAVCSVIDEPFGGLSFRFQDGVDNSGVSQMCLAFAAEPSQSVWGLVVYIDGTGTPPTKLTPDAAEAIRSRLS